MRDWNFAAEKNPALAIWFSAYLWGIETSGRPMAYDNGAVFSAYLWGIETVTVPVNITGGHRFSAYLWGIETKHDSKV